MGVEERVTEHLGPGLRVLAFKSPLGYILVGVTFGSFFTLPSHWLDGIKIVHPLLIDGPQKHLDRFSPETLAGIIIIPPP